MHFTIEELAEDIGGGGEAADERAGALSKGVLASAEAAAQPPYRPARLAQVDEMSLRLVHCLGTTPWHRHTRHSEMLWVREGRLEVGSEHGSTRLDQEDLVVIPRNTIHRLSSAGRAVAISLVHEEVPPNAHMGLMGETGLD